MRGLLFFVAGAVFGAFLMQPGSAAQEEKGAGLRLNHVGISVKDFDETVSFFTKTMGFREAFALRGADGKPNLAYIQISRETFLELAPASGDRPAGLTHFGIQADNVNATVAMLRQSGIKIDDPRPSRTGTLLTALYDPNGVRFELAQLPPDSLVRKAMESWK